MTSSPKRQWDQNIDPAVSQDVARKKDVGIVDPTQFGKLFVYQYDIGDFAGSAPETISRHTFNDLDSITTEVDTQQSFEGWIRYQTSGLDIENVVSLKIALRVDKSQDRDYSFRVTLNPDSGGLEYSVDRNVSGVVNLANGCYCPTPIYDTTQNVGLRFFVRDLNDTDCHITTQINADGAGWVTVANIRDNSSALAGDRGDTPYEWDIRTETGHQYTSGQTLWADNLSFWNNPTSEDVPVPLIVFFRTDVDGQTTSVISTVEEYTLGAEELSVYRNGLNLLLTGSLGSPIDRFAETSNTSITLGVISTVSDLISMVNDPDLQVVTQQTGVTGTSLTVPNHLTGQNLMMLFRNGLLMSVFVVGGLIDRYNETTPTTVTLLEAAVASEVFRAEVYGTSLDFIEEFEGNTGLTLTTSNAIAAADEKLMVFRNGALLSEGTILGEAVDRYQVTGANEITFEVALTAGTRITVLRRA